MTGPIDLTDVDAFVDQRHHEAFAWIRDNDPVRWNPTGPDSGFWALTTYEHVSAAYLDDSGLSSAGGPMLGGSFHRDAADTAANRMLVASDPPRHRMLRQTVRKVFASDFMARVGEQVTRLVDRSLDRAVAEGGCDFSKDTATELPAGAVMAIIGVGHADAHRLIDMTRRMIGFRDPAWVDTSGDERLRLAVIQSEIFEFFSDLLRDRRRAPGDDLVSVLAEARVNGRPLSDEDILFNCMNVAVGGNETSSYSAVAGSLALMENPDQYELLMADPGTVEPAVEEILRWATTNAYVLRVATRDLSVGGRLIREGDAVTLWNFSANRDEKVFADADSFQVRRSPNRHITYGVGIHRCIGAAVAQLELRILLRALRERGIRLSPAGAPVRLRSNFIQGISSLPVAVEVR